MAQLFLTGVIWGSAVLVAALTVLAWRQRPKPGATAFAVAMLSATWWVACSSLGLTTTDKALRLLWVKVEWAGVVYIPVAWLAFALAYTGRSEYLTTRNLAGLSVVPTATLALGVTNGAGHNLVFRSLRFEAFESVSLLHRAFGPWYWVHVAYSYCLLAAGTLLILRIVTTDRPLYRGQATALVLVVAAPWVANVLYLTGNSAVPSFDPTPYAFVISGAAGLAALTQFRFLDSVPVTDRVARESVLENLDAGVVVLDTDDRVVDCNPAAARLLDFDEAGVVGERVMTVLPDDVTPERIAAADGLVREVDGRDRSRHCAFTVTDITDAYDNVTGRIVDVRDVTDRRTRVQRLDVLNRVLRHNLRNEMNVVYGFADRLRTPDPDVEAVADDIQTKAEDLVALSDKAREIDTIFEVGERDPQPVDLREVVTLERDRIAGEYEVAVDSDLPDRSIHTDKIAGIVVRNLLENAAEHNTAEDPHVTVTVEQDDGAAVVTVTDNGPGIPEAERAPLDERVETQLDHASGIGLWLVSWGVGAVGGELEIADRDPTGTRVTVSFPPVEPDGE